MNIIRVKNTEIKPLNIIKSRNYEKRILVTGGCGFIGSNFIRKMAPKYRNYLFVNFDALTYAGNLENFADVDNYNYEFFKGDIRNVDDIKNVFEQCGITDIIHFAAESHVDRSIMDPNCFAETNIMGTLNLLNTAKEYWKDDYSKHKFHAISTDEVFGALDKNPNNKFNERTPYNPHSPYSASKASSDFLVKAYHDTYGMNVTISNCSNNYGPYQFPEKLIPLVINNIQEGKEIPIYGKGDNIRDWLYVDDHIDAIDLIFHKGKSGESYCIGGNCEKTNIEIIDSLIISYVNLYDKRHELTYEESHNSINYLKSLKKFVSDRKGHDFRYAIDYSKIKNELGWEPKVSFKEGIDKTVGWYIDHYQWVQNCIDGSYRDYYEKIYKNR